MPKLWVVVGLCLVGSLLLWGTLAVIWTATSLVVTRWLR